MSDVEARSRLSAILAVLEHEVPALRALEDVRLVEALRVADELRLEITATLSELDGGLTSNGDGTPTT
ncbi:MAG TPA: hypothetical protein VIK66_00130 [Gaiellaceae bacterium]|jgi:hypothetical protein